MPGVAADVSFVFHANLARNFDQPYWTGEADDFSYQIVEGLVKCNELAMALGKSRELVLSRKFWLPAAIKIAPKTVNIRSIYFAAVCL